MFGTIARAALYSPFAVLIGYILTRFMSTVSEFMAEAAFADAQSAQQIIGMTETAGNNFLLAALVSLLVMLLARAATESEVV